MPLKLPFKTVKDLNRLVDAYFIYIDGDYDEPVHPTECKKGITAKKTCTRPAEPPTITGLALAIGLNCRQEFDVQEAKGKFSATLKRARLRIESEYEKKLHNQPATGAIFALKSMGWNEKNEKDTADPDSGNIKVEIVESGPKLASNEKEVVM